MPPVNRRQFLGQVSPEMIGIGEVALRTAVDYAKSRVVFDRPIGANQSISHPLASVYPRGSRSPLSCR